MPRYGLRLGLMMLAQDFVEAWKCQEKRGSLRGALSESQCGRLAAYYHRFGSRWELWAGASKALGKNGIASFTQREISGCRVSCDDA